MTLHFENINGRVQEILRREKDHLSGLYDDGYKLSLSDAIFCAEDTVRNRVFFRAIGRAMKDLKRRKGNIHVVYAGSGTGILGIFALALGASSALFVEHNPHSLALSKKVVEACGFADHVEFAEGDATKIELGKTYDLLLSETITSGFVAEEFPFIINHLQPFGEENAIIIPQYFEVEMVECDEGGKELGGQHFSFSSAKKFERKNIQLQNPETQKVLWRAKVTLYDDVQVASGETMSFVNERIQSVDEAHPLFSFTKAGK